MVEGERILGPLRFQLRGSRRVTIGFPRGWKVFEAIEALSFLDEV
jgi:hypothetical protein